MTTYNVEHLSDVWDELTPLINERSEEVGYAVCPHRDYYRHVENAGDLTLLVARNAAGHVTGFMLMILAMDMHRESVHTAVCDIVFVTRSARPSGVGLRLLLGMESYLRLEGIDIMYVSAADKRLLGTLSKLGYADIETTMGKEL